MDKALDDSGLVISDNWYRSGQLVGLLRARLGRLVVLGSGRERVIHAVADWNSLDSFVGGYRASWPIQKLDVTVGDHGLFIELAWNFFGALRHHRVSSRLRNRPNTRFLHSDIPRDRCDWRPRVIRLAGTCT